ncbi:MAG: aminodeoxychorismate lyase [Lysobacteraceae bacterium]|nr:MAG: aminodeoxychorismate lyase [Xanthomonadaceae bacterium]
MNARRCELNGRAAGVDDLRHLVLDNYGHFTSMRAQGGCVQGLDLHLERLSSATLELFGTPLDRTRTRDWMRQAVAQAAGPTTLRVNVFSRALDRARLDRAVEPDVLVTTSPAPAPTLASARVRSVAWLRDAPHIKHVGSFGLFLQKRRAQAAGFDDALFIDPGGAVAEASIWNVGFFDGAGFVWPDAPALAGISMQLLKGGLAANRVPCATRRVELAEVAGFRGAFLTNSARAVLPLAAIDDVGFGIEPGWIALLEAALARHPWQAV